MVAISFAWILLVFDMRFRSVMIFWFFYTLNILLPIIFNLYKLIFEENFISCNILIYIANILIYMKIFFVAPTYCLLRLEHFLHQPRTRRFCDWSRGRQDWGRGLRSRSAQPELLNRECVKVTRSGPHEKNIRNMNEKQSTVLEPLTYFWFHIEIRKFKNIHIDEMLLFLSKHQEWVMKNTQVVKFKLL